MNAPVVSAVERYFSRFFETADQFGRGNFAPHLLEVLKALRWQGDIKALRDALPSGTDWLGFTDFLNTMAFLGYAPKVVKTRRNRIGPEMLPCLFVTRRDRRRGHGEVLFSPAKGWAAGTAYVFKDVPGATDIAADRTLATSNLKWFAKVLSRFRRVFWQVLVAGFVINLLTLVPPLFMMSVYDNVIGAHSAETLKYLLAGVGLAVAVEFSLRFLRARSLSWFSARLENVVRNAIVERILSLPAAYTERASVAAQLARLRAFESVREFFAGPLFLSFAELPFTLILVAAIAILAGPLVLIPLVIALLYGLLLLASRNRLRALTGRLAAANGERQNMNIETLNKRETLCYAGGFDAWLDRYEKTSADAAYAGYLYNRAVAQIDIVSQGLVVVGGVAAIYFGVERIWAGEMSMGALIAVLILVWRTLAPLQMACTALPRLDQVKRNVAQINRLMALTPELKPRQTFRYASKFIGEVEFYNVGLRYTKEANPVFAGLSFKAEPGQLVAIAGGNSTGKSTTLKLVSGLYQPQAGSIRIDGTDIRQIDPLTLRQNIAYVGQAPEFFSGTLGQNLQMVRPDATRSEMIAALHNAGLETWFEGLSQGLDTDIGFNGRDGIPESLRPHFALARAYLHDSPILLIDELPYEFLNGAAGQRFHDFLSSQKGKRTVLHVTYRQDYVDLADVVIQLNADQRPQVKERRNGRR